MIALLATLEDSELIARASFWQLLQTRRAIARGDRTQLVAHEDVLVFRKPTETGERISREDRTLTVAEEAR